MNKRKVIASCMLLFIVVGTLVACDSHKSKLYNANDPIQIIDGAGRQVSFPEPAQSVATTWGGSVNPYLYALGVGDRIVATNNNSGIHRIAIPNINEIQSVGSWKLDKEALAKISPDVYIHGWAATEQLEGANEVSVRSIGIKSNTFADVEDTVNLLGKVFGVEDRATYVNKYCTSIITMINEHVGDISENEKPVVFVMAEETGSVASDIYDTIEEMIYIAGGKSCVPLEISEGTDIVNVGLEKIFAWNPDYLFLQSVFGELSEEDILSDPAWQAMNAVKSGNVYAIPCEFDTWSSASPSSILGALYISTQLYPDLYYDIDFETIVIEFYQHVYGMDVSLEQLGLS